MPSERCTKEMKKEILSIVDFGIKSGLKLNRICSLVQIQEHRVRNWRKRGNRLEDFSPGPLNAPHALLTEEKDTILRLALDEEYMDDSHRVLAAKGADNGLFYVSASAVYSIMHENNLTADRSGKSHRNGRGTAPDRPDLTGPNQRWCWDISYCKTPAKGVFVYLFVLLDEYSRKVISWRISYHITHKEAMELIQEGLENECLTDVVIKLPDLINDRGVQMKAKAFKKLLKDIGINQQFARPRTPNDNPFIESLFSIVKGYHAYPEYFTDDIDAITYFTWFFNFYNDERYHGKINFVTPNQKHSGEDKDILKRRKNGLEKARKERFKNNRKTFLKQKLAFCEVLA